MVSLSSLGRLGLLASALAPACRRPPPRRLADAAVAPIDRPRPDAAVHRDAAVRDATPDAPRDVPAAGQPPPIDLFIVGGAGMVRPGATAQARVERTRVGQPRPDDVTATAAFRVHPPEAGTIEPGGLFHARTPGRAMIFAVVGGEEARTVLEVSNEVPAGMRTIPTVQISDGRVARSIRFDAAPDGSVLLDVQAERLSLRLAGRRAGAAFPITVPLHEAPPPGDAGLADAGADGPTGTLVLDRWAAGRLDGHATVRVRGETLGLRFTVFMADRASVCGPVTP
jgi:hypothetical protein